MKQFLKIYLWQVISLVSGFATMFIVTPYLAFNQNYFGIYTFVVSLSLFLSYADFGFLSAGVKFASEAYARNDRGEEQKILGFVFFIMAIVFGVFGLIILFFYFKPNFILHGLNNENDLKLTKDLLLVFIVSLPISIAQRGIQLVFNIRLHDYLFQRVSSVCNLLRIISVFYFFKNGGFHIVEFYLFTQFTTLLSVVIGCFIAKRAFKYDFIAFIKAIKFDREVYIKTKNLAFNSLFITISWILYYELDSLAIGKFVGLKEVAIFNICISIMTLSRSLYSIFYNPFSAKFNHFIGRKENDKLRLAYKKILIIGLPLSVIPTTILILNMRSFVYSWVGIDYASAVPIITVMFASYYFTFLSNPTSIAMVALQNVRSLYITSAVLPVVYWIGIIMTFDHLGLLSFGLFKFIAFALSAFLYFFLSKKIFSIQWGSFFYNNILPAIVTIALLSVLSISFENFIPETKGKLELLKLVGFMIGYGVVGMSFYYWLSKDFKTVASEVFLSLKGERGRKL